MSWREGDTTENGYQQMNEHELTKHPRLRIGSRSGGRWEGLSRFDSTEIRSVVREVDEQANNEAGGFQTGSDLRVVRFAQSFDGLEFQDDVPSTTMSSRWRPS